jgi:hypothetical protein
MDMFIYLIDYQATKEMMDRVGQPSPLKPVRPHKPWHGPALPHITLRFQRPRIEILVQRGESHADAHAVA